MENQFSTFPNDGKTNDRIFPTIPWSSMIVDVKVDKNCSDIEIEILSTYLKENSIEIEPTRFDLYSNPDSRITIGKEEAD